MRVVILGTGTDVGKTFATCRVAEGLRARTSVLALKPIETGVGSGAGGDAAAIARSAGHEPLLSRWRFTRPVSAHLAAREEGAAVRVNEVVAWVAEQEQRSRCRVTLVETAGGALSPLAPRQTNAELALALEPAIWLLIAPDSLGVLHDVSATLRALPRAPDAVLLCAARPPDASSGTNAHELELLGIARVLSVLASGVSQAEEVVAWLLASPSYVSRQ